MKTNEFRSGTAALALLLATPAFATPAFTAPQPTDAPVVQLDAARRDGYRAVFAAIRESRWSDAQARLDGMGDGPLHAVARAELALGKGSPKSDTATLSTLLEKAPDLPEAPQIAALLKRRGGDLVLPTLPQPRRLLPAKGAPRRLNARGDKSDLASARLAAQVKPFVKDDRAGEMEGYLIQAEGDLSPAALTEWRQRIAWTYYLAGDDDNALRLATQAAGGSGDFAPAGQWVAGLAAWRSGKCDPAAQSFAGVAARARDDEMRAAGWFWQARADMACRRPEKVQASLRAASRVAESFYGLLASRALGIAPPAPVKRASLAATDWSALRPHSNAQAAVALNEIGETALADRMLRWQAQIGAPSDHLALTHLAARLDLPSTQVWLAHNSPDGSRVDASARYPTPGWVPVNGWQVDRSLVYAHSLEESVFRVGATSGAGARGLMGIMPGTAEQLDRREGLPGTDRARLGDPTVNMAYGQRMLTWLRDLPSTGGLLPKVIAAYNAGPGANIKWNPTLRDRGDPLLWIESVPYVETRAYVGLVLRNYWMYQRQAGAQAPSLAALAQGMWPRFPGLAGETATRMTLPARPPVRLAVVMPPVRPKPVPVLAPDEPEVMLASADDDAAPAPAVPMAAAAPVRTLAATAPPVRTASGGGNAPARAMVKTPGRLAAAGAGSMKVAREVVRELTSPMVRGSAGMAPTGRLDSLLTPILKAELPKARASVKAGAAAVKRVVKEAVADGE